MNTYKEKSKYSISSLFRLNPVFHILAAVGVFLIILQLALRKNTHAMAWQSEHIVRPFHRIMGRLVNGLDFSVAGVLICLFALGVLVYIIYQLCRLIASPARLIRAYRLVSTLAALGLFIYGGFCLLWGVYYYSFDFEKLSALEDAPIATEALGAVTGYFTDLVNEYDAEIKRDGQGLFAEDLDAVFEKSASLYGAVEKSCPWLNGDGLRAKPVVFSRLLSYINFTGFFFPFTGEANINTDSPACFIPSTIAHELAHQRGVAAEDEANFVAVLACMESGDPVYCYSACLMAYTHLGNALYKADYDAWLENYQELCPGARADLENNNAYWARFETPVSIVSDAVYTGFLHSYGQEKGLQTYGACVDLLVQYYYEAATAG